MNNGIRYSDTGHSWSASSISYITSPVIYTVYIRLDQLIQSISFLSNMHCRDSCGHLHNLNKSTVYLKSATLRRANCRVWFLLEHWHLTNIALDYCPYLAIRCPYDRYDGTSIVLGKSKAITTFYYYYWGFNLTKKIAFIKGRNIGWNNRFSIPYPRFHGF